MKLTPQKIEILSDLFTNFSAGFFGTLLILPGFIGIRTTTDIFVLLFINIPCGILALLISPYFKEHQNA